MREWLNKILVRLCARIVTSDLDIDILNFIKDNPPKAKGVEGRIYINWNKETLTKKKIEVYRTKDPVKVLKKRVIANIDFAYFLPGDARLFIIENGVFINKN
jgi:hypothetical protein